MRLGGIEAWLSLAFSKLNMSESMLRI